MYAGAHDGDLACPLPTATEHFVILLMAFLWWPIVSPTVSVSKLEIPLEGTTVALVLK
jgi:hypothetical protein